MSDFNYQEYLRNNPLLKEEVKENKLITESQEITEGIPQESEIADYVTAMYDDSVVEKEGFQSDIWTKEEYTSPTRDGASIFIALMKHLNSVGGKDVLEGNPDIHLELLSNGDIKWSADVTLDENLATEEVEEVMGIDRKGNKKPDTDGSDASKFKRAAKDVKEVRIDRDVAERIESLLDRSMKAKFMDAFMDIYSDLLEEDNFFPEDIINHLNNEMHAELAGYQRQGDRLAGLEEDARTDAEEEGYKDGMKDEKEDMKEDARTDAEEEGYEDGFKDAKSDMKDAISKMKVSELKAKIKEDIISLLEEDSLEEDARTDAEEEGYKDGMKDEKEDLEGEDIEIDIEEPLDAETAQGGLTDDEREVQDALKLAYDNAIAMGDQKLADQIGNSITFFTRTHVVER